MKGIYAILDEKNFDFKNLHITVKYMIENGTKGFIEIGPGKVLSGLVKRIDKESNSYAVENIEDIENFVKNSLG